MDLVESPFARSEALLGEEAMKRLAEEGLVKSRPRLGSVVQERDGMHWRGHILLVVPAGDYVFLDDPSRTYRYTDENILYPFGYGLTYSKLCAESVRYENGKAIVSVRDNCVKFDPTSWCPREGNTDPMKGVGIKMVQQLSEEISYRHTLGLNVLTFTI